MARRNGHVELDVTIRRLDIRPMAEQMRALADIMSDAAAAAERLADALDAGEGFQA